MKPDQPIELVNAAELAGVSSQYIRRLARQDRVILLSRGANKLLKWSDVKRIISDRGSIPLLLTKEMLEGNEPPRGLLHRTQSHETHDAQPRFETNRVVVGHCIDWMQKMPLNCVQTVVTSPPYWGVRRYEGTQKVAWADGTKVPFGTEDDPDDYVRHSLEVLLHVKQVLRNDGTVWWNLGDTYHTRAVIRESTVERLDAYEGRRADRWKDYPFKRYSSRHAYLKDKDLALVPFKIALGAQQLGYWVRSVVIWAKENVMPEPIKDRPTTAHEYILMLAKSRFYYYDSETAKETAETEAIDRETKRTTNRRKIRTVWQFAVSTNHGNHTAAFPLDLPLRCIEIASRPGDLVFDPFVGSGTALIAADRLGRQFFGVDIASQYAQLAVKRIKEDRQQIGRKTGRQRGDLLRYLAQPTD